MIIHKSNKTGPKGRGGRVPAEISCFIVTVLLGQEPEPTDWAREARVPECITDRNMWDGDQRERQRGSKAYVVEEG